MPKTQKARQGRAFPKFRFRELLRGSDLRHHAFERLANLATAAAVEGRRRIRIRAPLLHLTKRDIIQLGTRLGVDYAMTTSCYDPSPSGEACGHCDACQLRLRPMVRRLSCARDKCPR